MRIKHYVIAALVGGALAVPVGAYAEDKAEEIIRKSAQTLEQLKQNKIVPPATLARAKCVGVFPDVTEAALVVGGSHGDGVLTCKNNEGKWSRVGFVDLAQGSVGAQVGAKRSDIVMVFLSEKSKQAMSKGTFTFGGDLTATLGKHGVDVNVDTAGPDVVAYASDNGLFAGASLSGTRISADEDTMKQYYRQDESLAKAIGNYDPTNSATEQSLISAISAARTPQG